MCRRIRNLAYLAVLLLVGVAYSPAARADTCPSGAVATGLSFVLTAFHSDGHTPIVGPVSACETIVLQASLAYTPFDSQNNIVAAFQFGTVTIQGTDVTPVGGVPLVGPPSCVGSVLQIGSQSLSHPFTAAEIAAGTVTLVAAYSGGTAHIGASDIPNVESAGTAIQVTIAPCVALNACETVACVNGVCVHTPKNCDDGNACTTDTCNPASGCVNTPIVCNDNNACTTDTCNPASGCVFTPNPPCNDNNACTTDTCDPASGCVFTPNPPCNDNNACTTDTCNPASGCVFTPNPPCNDNNACTTDTCNPATGCVFTPNPPCNDNNTCTTDTCDPATGCVYTAISCDDNDVCTTDTCDPVLGCQHTDNGQCACVTRTQGYWFNHIIAPKGINPAGCATLSAVFDKLGGTIFLGFANVNLDQAIGMFWTKGPSTPLCQARQKLATQLIAAISNATLLNTPGTACVTSANAIILAAQTAAAGCDIGAITAAKDALDAFNNSGDALSFPAGLGACGAGKENKDFIAAHSAPPGASCSACP